MGTSHIVSLQKDFRYSCVVYLCLILMGGHVLRAQRASLEDLKYADTIIYNGNIITIENPDFGTDLGTIAQAMAIRRSRIIAVGSNAEMQTLVWPRTKRVDRKGRMVLPGVISTHEHPQDWQLLTHGPMGRLWSRRLSADISQGTPREQLAKVQPTLVEAVSKAKPGQWIRIYMYRGKMKDYSRELVRDLPKVATKSILNGIAPNNPLEIKGGTSAALNTKAVQEVLRVGGLELRDRERATLLERGIGGPTVSRIVEGSLLFEGNLPLMARVYKAELEYWASLGLTTFISAQEASEAVRAYRYLDDRREMPIRHGWSYRGPGGTESSYSMSVLNFLASMVGHGSEYLWFSGARTVEVGSLCTTINARPEVKDAETCNYAPGSPDAANMYNLIKSGLRIFGLHTDGDKDVDYITAVQISRNRGAGMKEIGAFSGSAAWVVG